MSDHLLINLDLGDVNVKEFGKKGDYLLNLKEKILMIKIVLKLLKKKLKINFKEMLILEEWKMLVQKVSKELLESGLLAISLALAAMLFYIWVRFEWQFSVGSIIAIFHDVLITIGLFSFVIS